MKLTWNKLLDLLKTIHVFAWFFACVLVFRQTTIQNYVNKVFNISFNDENIPTDILFGNSDVNRLMILTTDKNIGSLIIGKISLGYIVHGQTEDSPSKIVGCLAENHDLPIDSIIRIII